jgi:hypothetical protein
VSDIYDFSLWSRVDNGPCPPGHYCPNGTVNPIQCPSGYVRSEMYGVNEASCSNCAAGEICYPGDPVAYPCPKGMWCEYGKGAQYCPPATYNDQYSATSREDCLGCPAGYFCFNNGTSDYTNYPCPAGYYCLVNSTMPIQCPQGRYRNTVAARRSTDCPLCPGGYRCDFRTVNPVACRAGYYCPTGSVNETICPAGHYCTYASANATICPDGYYCSKQVSVPLACLPGTYCPAGSTNMSVCPAGNYCPANTGDPILCPSSYYCGVGAKAPIRCPNGTYCPPGTDVPNLCPLGYYGESRANNRSLASLDLACQPCPPGTYGTDPRRLACYTCTPGYVCLGGTTTATPTNNVTEKGYVCPRGFYCPAGSSIELSCPPGTYQPDYQESNRTSCTQCPVKSYNPLEGQYQCLTCSSSSTAKEGSTACYCIGLNRVFQGTQGLCLCAQGYVAYDSNLNLISDQDGTSDCQPLVYDRCAAGYVRDLNGVCRASSDCSAQCGASGGEYVTAAGVCQCNDRQDLDSVCDSTCRTTVPTIKVARDGQIVITEASGNQTDLSADDIGGFSGQVSCGSTAPSSCNAFVMQVGSTGFSGVFGTGESLSSASGRRRRRLASNFGSEIFGSFVNPDVVPDIAKDEEFDGDYDHYELRRRLLAGEPTLANPLVCIKAQDTMFWDVSNTYYPQYVKDSLLNSNPDFDYSAFLALAEKASSTATVSSFGFTFTEPGTYVFKTSSDAAKITVIAVMEENVACTTDAQFTPITAKNLAVIGVTSDSDIILTPDWSLIGGLLGGLVFVIFGVISTLYYFRRKAWTVGASSMPRYRKKAQAKRMTDLHSKGSVMRKGQQTQDVSYCQRVIIHVLHVQISVSRLRYSFYLAIFRWARRTTRTEECSRATTQWPP